MTARTLILVLLIGSLSTFIWAQNQCTQYHTWELSGHAGYIIVPDPDWVAYEGRLQAQYGGAGPTCTYTESTWWPGQYYGEPDGRIFVGEMHQQVRQLEAAALVQPGRISV